jgi:SAM-dependent methyltransferase
VLVCQNCWLVQTEDFTGAEELFTDDYAYFSGYSATWHDHCQNYVERMIERFRLRPESLVVEVAANDGTLLSYVKARGIACLGIEPTASTAAAARAKGIEVVQDFFGIALAESLARAGRQADLIAANNVLAHVPDINDFVVGFTRLLKPQGVATFEFPHLLRLITEAQFDTIYHEHFSYLSLGAVVRIFTAAGLKVFDVEELSTHGGSLRVYAQRSDSGSHAVSSQVAALLEREQAAGLFDPALYAGFQPRVERIKNAFLSFLLEAKRQGKRVAAYGAAAKGNTLLNYAGVRPDLLPYVVDRNPAKQGKYLPGSRIPVVDESRLKQDQPDYIVILPWNLREEITAHLAYTRTWGARFVTTVPELEVV